MNIETATKSEDSVSKKRESLFGKPIYVSVYCTALSIHTCNLKLASFYVKRRNAHLTPYHSLELQRTMEAHQRKNSADPPLKILHNDCDMSTRFMVCLRKILPKNIRQNSAVPSNQPDPKTEDLSSH